MATSGWNRPKETQSAERRVPSGKHGVLRGTLAGICVVALAGAAVWFFLLDNPKPEQAKDDSASRKIKTVQPAKPRKVSETATAPAKASLPLPKPSGQRVEKREGVAEPQPLEEMETALTNKTAKEKRYVPFKNGAEQLIALATPSSPGAPVPPLPMITDEGVAKDLEAAMKHVITAHEKDTESTLEKKIIVADAKEEFRELREKEGWSFTEYLNALRNKANLDSELLAESHKICNELYHDATISDDDYVKYRDQINDKLRERGLPEIDKEEDKKETTNE